MQAIQIRRKCEVQSEITIVMQDGQDGSRYPLSSPIGLRWLDQRVYITTPSDPPGKSEASDPTTDPRAWRLLPLPKPQRRAIGI